MKDSYVLITESALERALSETGFEVASMLPKTNGELKRFDLSDQIVGYRTSREPAAAYYSLIKISCLQRLKDESGTPSDIYRRIVRVVKGLKSPPVHLPRKWSEYHHKNLIAFFALPFELSQLRWIAELNSLSRCVKFDHVYERGTDANLTTFASEPWPRTFQSSLDKLSALQLEDTAGETLYGLAAEVDLQTIGSSSIVSGRSYDAWFALLTDSQKNILANDLDSSIRIVGPAGSGKTLSLCMRAIQISRDRDVSAQGKKILIVTHSWAMAERIDQTLLMLSGDSVFIITVLPLLSLLEIHAGNIGRQRIDVIGDDSTDGRNKSINIIRKVLESGHFNQSDGISLWVAESLKAANDSRARLDLSFNLYEEITGVIAASGVAPDDQQSIQKYYTNHREDWMPPFVSIEDRAFVISVYEGFLRELIDRSAITTDQFILDSIRILETFTWRMRRETDGYDYILVDELQLFDPQERSAVELLGRSRTGTPFVTSEDPSQGVFAALHASSQLAKDAPVYLETVHRFNPGIFNLISFLYQQFPLNAVALRMSPVYPNDTQKPILLSCKTDSDAIRAAASKARLLNDQCHSDDRICLATLGDVDKQLLDDLQTQRLQVTELEGFDDVEQLAYKRKSIVVAPWQYVGGTQFAHIILVAAGVNGPTSQFAKLREKIAVYLACSRAAKSLTIVCAGHVPEDLLLAMRTGLIINKES